MMPGMEWIEIDVKIGAAEIASAVELFRDAQAGKSSFRYAAEELPKLLGALLELGMALAKAAAIAMDRPESEVLDIASNALYGLCPPLDATDTDDEDDPTTG